MELTAETMQVPVRCTFDEDLALVHASQSGDISAFEALVRKYDRKLLRIAQNVTHSLEDAEDAVQTAFFKAYQNLGRFQGTAKFSTWLIRIALNESFMKLRKQRGMREQSLDSDAYADSDGNATAAGNGTPFDVADWAPSPEALYGTVELREILTKTLERLSPSLRIVFVLRDIEEHSILETSSILGLTATAVKARLSRARLQLREELSRYFKKRGRT